MIHDNEFDIASLPCPAFALPLPAGRRQVVDKECFLYEAICCFSEHKDYMDTQ